MSNTILDQIIQHKRQEVARAKELYPTKLLEQSSYFTSPTVSLKKYLKRPEMAGIIAEIKRKSPSKGIINKHVKVEQLSLGYMQAGASALSVLTDQNFFGGSNLDLTTARRFNFCPILRKDFIVDQYQLVEARSIGADVILLIAAALTPEETKTLSKQAKDLGLEVLLEVHSASELESHFLDTVDIVGVNNRNLKDFSVSFELSCELAEKIPASAIKISESGIDSAENIKRLKTYGYSGFLIGEAFMRTSDPAKACAQLINELR